MEYRNKIKAIGNRQVSRSNFQEELRKIRITESPQFIPPLDNALINRVKDWIYKIHLGLGNNGVKFKVFNIRGYSVINLLQVRIPSYNGRKNVFYYVNENGVAFFSLYEIKRNLKGIDQTITQFLVYRDPDNNENGYSSMTLNDVAWELVFPITKSFLCDKQQTKYGRKSWEFIVKQSYQKGYTVSVYDDKLKTLTKIPTLAEYDDIIKNYYGTEKDYQRYQILIKE